MEVVIFFAGVFVTVFTNIENGIYVTIAASFALLLWRRQAFIPIDRKDGSNPLVDIESPYPGILIYRFTEGFTYLNQQGYMDEIVHHAQTISRPTELNKYTKIGDLPWNDPGRWTYALGAIQRTDFYKVRVAESS